MGKPKVVILAGGLGTRLSEETALRPKPMVEIGGRPIIWHIMKTYSAYGFSEFVVALGYLGHVIKDYFANYNLNSAPSATVDLGKNAVHIHSDSCEDWVIHLVDTGLHTQTGGRLRRLEKWIADETFMLTYGDGVCDVDIGKLLAFHRSTPSVATVTAVRPPSRFGAMVLDGAVVSKFEEKPQAGEGWINGGYFVLEPEVLSLVEDDTTVLEYGPISTLAARGDLQAYRHDGFWQGMDTLRDVRSLNPCYSWRRHRQCRNECWKLARLDCEALRV